MSTAEALYRLQTLDLRLETLRQALHADEQQVGEAAELNAARAAVAGQRAAIHDADLRQRDLELQLAEVEGKLREIERKLYGGNVRNPKELHNWELDAAQIRQHKSDLEDALLRLMDEIEAATRTLRAAEETLRQTEATWQAGQSALKGQVARLRAELAEVERERAAHAATIDAPSRTVYERLRRERGGRAVARIEQSTCQGCRLSLPAAVVQRARIGPELVFCGTCGRILCPAR